MCDAPTVPANGSLFLLDENKTATYSCDSGFTLNGSAQRICQSDGTGWSGSDPKCGNNCRKLVMCKDVHV